jgi:hypothetical protein
MDLTLTAREAQITPDDYRHVKVELEDVEIGDILDQIDIQNVMDHFDSDDLLEKIGPDAAMKYFDLVEKE